MANVGVWPHIYYASEIEKSVIESRYSEVVQLLHQAESDIVEDCSTSSTDILYRYVDELVSQAGKYGRLRTTKYLQRLKECGFIFDGKRSDEVIFAFKRLLRSGNQVSAELISTILRILLNSGLDICAMEYYEYGAVHILLLSEKLEGRHAHNMIEIASALLQNGADPCALDYLGESPFDYAERHGWTAEWFEALGRAGYDIDEVKKETERRQWLFDHPGGAYVCERSGIDEEMVAPPARDGLVLRRAIVGDRLED